MADAKFTGPYMTYFISVDIAYSLYRARILPYHYLQITTDELKLDKAKSVSSGLFQASDYWNRINDIVLKPNKDIDDLTQQEKTKVLDFQEDLLVVTASADSFRGFKEDKELLSKMVNLGDMYAEISPQLIEEDAPNFYLDTLWREKDFSKGSSEFKDFISGFEDPYPVIEHQEKLLYTSTLVSSVQEDLGDAVYVADFLTLARDVADLKLNDPENSVPGDSFVEDVWNAETEDQLVSAAQEFNTFVETEQLAFKPPIVVEVLRQIPGIAPFLILPGSPLNPLPVGESYTNPFTQLDYLSQEEYDAYQFLTEEQYETLEGLHELILTGSTNNPQLDYLNEAQIGQLERIRNNNRYKTLFSSLRIDDRRAADEVDDNRRCAGGHVNGHLGPAVYGQYATYVSGDPNDFYLLTPDGESAFFDGKSHNERRVWEAKYRYVDYIRQYGQGAQPGTNIIYAVDLEVINENRVAKKCLFEFTVAFSHIYAYNFFLNRWSDPSGTGSFPEDIQYIYYRVPS
ncbi:MAG: hypothetical protein AAFW75_12265 [Cyanobacteria bacterium J06636_16]